MVRRIVKGLLSLSICLSLIVSVPVFAEDNCGEEIKLNNVLDAVIDIDNIALGEKVILKDGAILTPISEQEYIRRLMEENEYSIVEARHIESQAKNMRSGTTYYYNYSKKFTHPKNSGCTAILEATLKIWADNSYKQIENVMGVGSRRNSGTYQAQWIETYHYSDPQQGSSSFPTTKIVLGASGYFRITSTYALNTSTQIPGFSLGSSSGGTYTYESTSLNMNATYSLY